MPNNANPVICAVDIVKLWYGDTSLVTADLTGAALATLLQNPDLKSIDNVHQDTWQLEESEPSQDTYKNQLNGQVYRMGRKQAGDLTASWTIGQYDYELKKEFLGGAVLDGGKGWKRPIDAEEVKKVIVSLTVDGQYCVFPYANITSNEANTDKAIGLKIKATAMLPTTPGVSAEYWFDKSAVV